MVDVTEETTAKSREETKAKDARGRPRKPKSERKVTVTLSLPPKLAGYLNKLTKATGYSRSEVAEKALLLGMEEAAKRLQENPKNNSEDG